jgi:hypothetical protein
MYPRAHDKGVSWWPMPNRSDCQASATSSMLRYYDLITIRKNNQIESPFSALYDDKFEARNPWPRPGLKERSVCLEKL